VLLLRHVRSSHQRVRQRVSLRVRAT
jgi:hypothetical protein